jgi:CheY-like chemotaxis protein
MAGERILIVEDDVTLVGLPLANKLRKAGYEVVGFATTADDAVEIAIRVRPALVLMDIQLKDHQGNDDDRGGLRAAREIRDKAGIPIVFVTGTNPRQEIVSEAKEVSGNECLSKPVQAEKLLDSIRMALSRVDRNYRE